MSGRVRSRHRELAGTAIRIGRSCGQPGTGERRPLIECEDPFGVSDRRTFVERAFLSVVREDLHRAAGARQSRQLAGFEIEIEQVGSGQVLVSALPEPDTQGYIDVPRAAIVVNAVLGDLVARRNLARDGDAGCAVVGNHVIRPNDVEPGIPDDHPHPGTIGQGGVAGWITADGVSRDRVVTLARTTDLQAERLIAADDIVSQRVVIGFLAVDGRGERSCARRTGQIGADEISLDRVESCVGTPETDAKRARPTD